MFELEMSLTFKAYCVGNLVDVYVENNKNLLCLLINHNQWVKNQ